MSSLYINRDSKNPLDLTILKFGIVTSLVAQIGIRKKKYKIEEYQLFYPYNGMMKFFDVKLENSSEDSEII